MSRTSSGRSRRSSDLVRHGARQGVRAGDYERVHVDAKLKTNFRL